MPRKGSKKYVYPYESYKDAQSRYRKASVKDLRIAYTNTVYNEIIKPAIDKSGMKVATFFKLAVREKIEREGLMPEGKVWPDQAEDQTEDQVEDPVGNVPLSMVAEEPAEYGTGNKSE